MISIIAIAFVAVLAVVLLGALLFGVFNWQKSGGKALAIVSGGLLLCGAVAVAGFLLLRLSVRDRVAQPAATIEPAPAPR